MDELRKTYNMKVVTNILRNIPVKFFNFGRSLRHSTEIV